MKNKYMICAAMILSGLTASAQNVGINVAGATPHASSILDLNTGNTFTSPNGKGMLIPNVALTGTGDATTVASPATSLMVYNTATAGAGATAVTPGYYYWNGTQWVQFQSSSNASQDWKLTGNAGTTAGTNFIGTTDAVDFVTKTNNAERMRVTSTGNVGINCATPNLNNVGTSMTMLGSGTNRANLELGSTNALTGNGVFGQIAGYNGAVMSSLIQYSSQVGANDGEIKFFTKKASDPIVNEKMRITNNGNVGIGTPLPATKLTVYTGTVNGAIQIIDGTEGAGKVLTSDANGVGTWVTPAGSTRVGYTNGPAASGTTAPIPYSILMQSNPVVTSGFYIISVKILADGFSFGTKTMWFCHRNDNLGWNLGDIIWQAHPNFSDGFTQTVVAHLSAGDVVKIYGSYSDFDPATLCCSGGFNFYPGGPSHTNIDIILLDAD